MIFIFVRHRGKSTGRDHKLTMEAMCSLLPQAKQARFRGFFGALKHCLSLSFTCLAAASIGRDFEFTRNTSTLPATLFHGFGHGAPLPFSAVPSNTKKRGAHILSQKSQLGREARHRLAAIEANTPVTNEEQQRAQAELQQQLAADAEVFSSDDDDEQAVPL